MSKPIKITYKPTSLGRWNVFHDGNLFDTVHELPHYARPVSEATPADAKRTRQAKKADDAQEGYQRRAAASDFDSIRQKMVAVAGEDAELLEQLNSDPDAFNRAHDSIRLDELSERHRARIEAIKDRQYGGNGRDRNDADLDAVHAHEEFRAERERIAAGNYESTTATEEE